MTENRTTYEWKAGFDQGFDAGVAQSAAMCESVQRHRDELALIVATREDQAQLLSDCYVWIAEHAPKRGAALLRRLAAVLDIAESARESA